MKGFWYGLIAILATSVLLLAQPTLTQQQRVTPAIPVCMAPAPPDLDCADINATNFEVRQPAHMGSIATRMALAVKLPKQSLSHIQLKVG